MLKAVLWISLLFLEWTSTVNGKVLWFSSEQNGIGTENGLQNSVEDTSCKNPHYVCPGNQTCCPGPGGNFACCPYPQGVCCLDGKHCCPRETKCDMAHQRCYRQVEVGIEIFEAAKNKKASNGAIKRIVSSKVKDPKSEMLKSIKCPDGKSGCPDANTCCKLASGAYGCCRLPKAVCCSDGQHCCPNGFTCAVSSGKCYKGDYTLPLFLKKPAYSLTPEIVKESSVECPDGKSLCPNGQTCCRLLSGTYGCCPSPKAVCCSDGVNCCPNGYKCLASAGGCQKGSHIIPPVGKTQALTIVPEKANGVVCPGGQVECPDGNTCCLTSYGVYGCCPYPQAVCCSDGVHCCPNGYTCDLSAGTCRKGSEVMPLVKKSPALTAVPEIVENVICPGDESECPDGNTCCKSSHGGYGCCPLPGAACCTDGVHCCPHGYSCDLSAGGCMKGSEFIMFFRKSPPENKKVVCPGGSSRCPDANTCCELSSGNYGCCPLTNAVCCSDGAHCCPNGYTCNLSAETCQKGKHVLPLLGKSPALTIMTKNVENVVCPGSKYECPSGNTCCKLPSGSFGCCPLPQAVCCSDGVHCCPNGYTCDLSAGSCQRGSEVIALTRKLPSRSLVPKTVKSVVCPDGKSGCPDGNTCCKQSSGDYGCCPLPKAVCCSDGVHCCPNGYTCDVSAGTCQRGSEIIALTRKLPGLTVVSKTVNSVVCPDGKSGCPDGNTCCKQPSGSYGCCPLPQAVCCSDGVHCCPNGYTCDVSAGTCQRGSEVIALTRKLQSRSLVPKTVNSVVCPDGQSECQNGNTCCKQPSGDYGCCPLPKAVCCSDGVHCCPNGYTCDVSAGTCQRGSEIIALTRKLPGRTVVSKTVNSVVCPDGKSGCPDGNTCCKQPSGSYGCCPLPQAVCCSDGVHCCPNGYTCDVSAGTCQRGSEIIALTRKLPGLTMVSKTVKSVVCPDGKSGCPDGNTCCKQSSGDYGCCPLPKAVCCSDGVHCCPNGYTCDVSAGTCQRGSEIIALTRKLPGLTVVSKTVKSVVCPDGKSGCPDGNTCCKQSSGDYGCCPLPKAVCCSDGVHCCPNGYKCDVSAGTCQRGSEIIALTRKLPGLTVVSKTVNSVVCPDGKSGCPDGNTCCKQPSGSYGCCPLPQAVCCSDGVHCCPNGYTCDVSAGTCQRGSEVIALTRKLQSRSLVPKTVNSVVCPDGQSECQNGNTCCKQSSGDYGCCPLPKAVCCSDGVHCCPNGYTCDVSAGTCQRGSEIIALTRKLPGRTVVSKTVNSVVCPDGKSGCPDGNTCCKQPSGSYGCCPLPQAVCCSDGVHCCPNGYTCDVSAGTCQRGSEIIALTRKLPGLTMVSKTVKSVVCPDGKSGCPDGNTCCKQSSGDYGCCPLPKAVCCSDGVHCCPNGYTCDVSAGTCQRGSEIIALTRKLPGLTVVSKTVNSVVCPDGKSGCPDGNTCCKQPSGSYGCCPLPQAVCCSDGVHCCPNGYTCDVSAGTCQRGSEVIALTRKLPGLSLVPKAVNSVVCPGGQYGCPDGNTCCRQSSGAYGCCPLPQAVCCSDGVHCCPNGYTCDLSAGTCQKGSEVIALIRKLPGHSLVPTAVNSVVCPGGQVQCPDGNTCCKQPSGSYGCCPLPQAVCCSDGVHCCPNGYTCDLSAGTCQRGSEVIALTRKLPGRSLVPKAVNSVVCPGGQVQCPDGNTCCKQPSGSYGCCPLPQAVCCSDGVHCCPNGYTCDLSAGTCQRGSEIIALTRKLPGLTVVSETVNGVVCPDGKSGCPDGNTCCKQSSGDYGCCPLPQAVCCSDGVHCCPNGYSCDVSAGTCQKGSEVIALTRKLPSHSLVPKTVNSVVCPGGQYGCPDGNTCCRQSSGAYGCCPLPQAVCCSDGVHCCPNGYKCDLSAGTCQKGSEVIALTRKLPGYSLVPTAVNSVVCPGGQSECPDGNTCCRQSSGAYGCCPLPNAVCCSDHIHCCPDGYKCDLSAGSCAKGEDLLPLFVKHPARSIQADSWVGKEMIHEG